MFVVPHLGLPGCSLFNPQPQRLLLALAGVTPTGTEGELAFRVFDAMGGKQAVVDLALVDHVEAEQPIGGERCMGAGDARLQPFNAAAVMDGIEKAGDQVLDLGTGTGIIPILMEAKTKATHLTGLEIQEESADMARRSVAINHLEDKINIVTGDIKKANKLFKAASFQVITCNPPYMIGQHGIVNPDSPLAIARHEILCTLEDVIKQAAVLLVPGGSFYLVHRPFRLAEIMCMLTRYKLEPKRMQLVYPFVDREPNMVLLEAKRGGKPRMTVEKPLIVYKEPDKYTDDIYDIYGY